MSGFLIFFFCFCLFSVLFDSIYSFIYVSAGWLREIDKNEFLFFANGCIVFIAFYGARFSFGITYESGVVFQRKTGVILPSGFPFSDRAHF